MAAAKNKATSEDSSPVTAKREAKDKEQPDQAPSGAEATLLDEQAAPENNLPNMDELIEGGPADHESVFTESLAAIAASAAVDMESAADVAVAGLCQSYTHALSIAFHNAVLSQQRRNIVGQAAVQRAVKAIMETDPKDFEERLQQLKKGLDVLGVSGKTDMDTYNQLTAGFKESIEVMVNLRDQIFDKSTAADQAATDDLKVS